MDRKTFLKQAGLGAAGLASATAIGSSSVIPDLASGYSPPNIILIMADDMGFSDVGCYGSDIRTPNLDGLANNGAKFSQFYNAARCCPTRASLMTGLYPHQSGVGHMMADRGAKGYRGDLNDQCLTIAEVLNGAGYSSYMSGKWHLTKHIGHWSGEEKLTSKHNWPLQRGFDRFYGTIIGAGSYYNPISLTRGNRPIEPESGEYYYTDRITDSTVEFIDDHHRNKKGQPFFSYVSYTAPHWPLHALEEDIQRYKGQYLSGWDKLRQERIEKMRDMQLIDDSWELSERHPRVPAWDKVKHKEWEAHRMATYAAQIDRMDQGIGRIVKTLKKNGQFENTLILFLADNGGSAEVLSERWQKYHAVPQRTRAGEKVKVGNKKGVMAGPADTYQSYGRGWANASDTPFRLYKHYVHEGGIASPMIAHWPAQLDRQEGWKRRPSHLIDIMATCVDAANASYPRSNNGKDILPMEGQSLLPVMKGDDGERNDILCWEHTGNRAIRDGRWKLVQRHKQSWELFDMKKDRTETTNLVERNPAKANELKEKYHRWADRVNVLPWPVRRGN